MPEWILIGSHRTHVATPRPIRLQNKRRRCSTRSCRWENVFAHVFVIACIPRTYYNSSNAWRIKGWSNSCLPHTSIQKKSYGCFQQLFITETAKFHCSMKKTSGFTGVLINFDVCLCWWKHLINDHTTQHNITLYSDDTQTTLSLALTACEEHEKIKTTSICVTSEAAPQHGADVGIFQRFCQRVKMQCFCADISVLKSSTDPR